MTRPDISGQGMGSQGKSNWFHQGSLRARLLGLLLVAILVAALAQAIVVYREARVEADSLFDYHMRQTAEALRSGVGLRELPPPPDALVRREPIDMLVQIWRNDGLSLFQSDGGLGLPQRAVMGFADVAADGTTFRVYSLQTPYQVIQVAQDMRPRRELARALAWKAVMPVLWVAPLLMLVAWWAVNAALRPMERVRRQVASRQVEDLEPVGEEGVPDEVRPLVLELNGLLARVRKAFDAQQHFVADAAHELRSPLAALRLQVQAMERAPDEAARSQAASRLLAGIDRATRLVEQLLMLARQQAGSQAPLVPVDLGALIRETVAELHATAQSRGLDLGVGDLDEEGVLGQVDALRVLLRNLLDNAIKYTPRGGRIDVSLAKDRNGMTLCVQDSGPGIPPEERERVLDRFYRGGAGSGTGGSGLGLAIVSAIASVVQGRLVLDESPDLGGLRVRLYLKPAPSTVTV